MSQKSINRISPKKRPSKNKSVKEDKPRATPWLKHLKICEELYNVKQGYVKSDGIMREIYFLPKLDEYGNRMYPKTLMMNENAPMDKYIYDKEIGWTGKAMIDPDGESAHVRLYV